MPPRGGIPAAPVSRPPVRTASAQLNPGVPYHPPVARSPMLSGGNRAGGPSPAPARPAPVSYKAGGNPGSDVQSVNGYGNARADAFKQTKAYHDAIVAVFNHQPTAQKAAIIQGLVKTPGMIRSPEGVAVRDALKGLSNQSIWDLRNAIPHQSFISKAEGALTSGGQALSGLIQQIPTAGFNTPGEHIAAEQGFAPGQIGKNLLKDAVNLPAEVGPSVAIPIKQALQGHVGQALNTAIVNPVKQFIHDPAGMVSQHPLDSFLMFGGPLHGITRIADQGARALLGKPADLQRPSIALTGNLTKERPNYSKFPLIRHNQKGFEKAAYKPVETGVVVPRTESRLNKQIRAGVSQRVGMNERVRRVEVMNQQRAHSQAVLASKPARAVAATKNALKYNPDPALIHGASVLSLIAQGVIRRPATYIADLSKHLDQVAATRTHLLDFPKALKEHDAYVKSLQAELARAKGDKNLQRNIAPAFAAAESHAKGYAPLEAQAHAFGHFGKDVTAENLQRRTVTPVVDAHMPRARFDPEKKTMVVDTPTGSRVLTTAEMQAFAKEQTGGRTLSYGSHQAPKGDSAFYVSGQKFPSKAVQRNTMYAFHHGLTDPSHEALLQSRVYLQGVVSAHKSMGRLIDQLSVKRDDGGHWKTFAQAKKDAPPGYRPINVGTIHGYADHVSPNDAVNASSIEQEALTHSLDLNARLQPSEVQGKWSLIHNTAIDQLRKHENQISPNALMRGFRGTTGQFRKVALGTSVKHIPGVAQENLLRDIASGVFIHHLFAEKNVYKAALKIDPELAVQRRIEQGGGQVAGGARALETRQISRHFSGTAVEGPLKGFEAFMKAPGPRQLSTAWNAWLHFAIDGTKRYLEESHQRAAVGKQLLNEFGGLMRLQGDAAHQAALHGYLPDKAARRLRAGTERMFGHWTDLTPEAQTALMVSPFGMWWVNSVRWLGRLPTDHPLGTAALAATNVGTEKQRQAQGLDMFAPNHLPLFLQGSIPLSGGKVAQSNYYSPFGVANNPIETIQSLLLPTFTPQAFASVGDNWLGRQMSSPKKPHGGETNSGQRALVILNSVLGNLVPLYQKAQTIVQGGGSSYDTSTLFKPQTKQPNAGPLAGVAKIMQPLKIGHASKTASASSGSGYFGGSSSAPSSSSGSSSGYFGASGGSSSAGSGGSGYFAP